MITARLDENDYLHAQALHRRWSQAKRLIAIGLVAGVIALSWFLWQQGYAPIAGGIIGGLIGGVISGTIVRYVYVPWKSRLVFKQQKSLQREFTLDWDDNFLLSQDAYGRYKTAWSDFIRYKESDHIFLLYHSDIIFQMIPKRAFLNTDLIESFRSQLQRIVHV